MLYNNMSGISQGLNVVGNMSGSKYAGQQSIYVLTFIDILMKDRYTFSL